MANPIEGLITRAEVSDLARDENLILDDEERISVLESTKSIDVQACPGSGKTTLIAAKLILLAKKWRYQDQGICVLSHTNVAKDEIIGRIKRSSATGAQRLLSYPHFIGTIHEFVGKYLAFPLLRSDGITINIVDSDECVRLIKSRLPPGTRGYIERKSQYSDVLYDFDLKYGQNGLEINVPTFPNGSESKSYQDLRRIRTELIAEGCLFYRDVFAFAHQALEDNCHLAEAIRQRFPCVFIDEMQDTQQFQDELLLRIFTGGESGTVVHRLGDPDQAIFQAFGNEEPNASFNGKSRHEMDIVIYNTHRFDAELADKVRAFSLNQVPLETELDDTALRKRAGAHADRGKFQHTIIVFDDETRCSVLEKFSDIVLEQFSDAKVRSSTFSAKAVGAVGNEIDPARDELKIGHYWSDYDKSKARWKFQESTLIEAVRYCRDLSEPDFQTRYRILIDCILKALRMAGVCDDNGQFLSATRLREKLIAEGNWRLFREHILQILDTSAPLNEEKWREFCGFLVTMFRIDDISGGLEGYLRFEADRTAGGHGDNRGEMILSPLRENRIRHRCGFELQLSTIHGIKGETHDATLILETKNHTFDVETMLPYLVGTLPSDQNPIEDLPDKPNSKRAFKPNRIFMRQLYVAASRPRHLLCMAIHDSRICDDQKESLTAAGWRIMTITSDGESSSAS